MASAPRREAAVRVGLLAVSLGVAVLFSEVVLAAAGWTYSPMRIEVEGTTLDWRFAHAFRDEHFVFDPVLLWRPRAGHVPFNGQGYRGPELAADKAADELRVFALGDSNTLGWAEADGANWPLAMTPHLALPGRRVVVVNAGAWGYASYQGLARLREVLAWKPDVVLVSFGANDGHPVAISDAEYGATPFFASPVFRSPLFRSRVFQLGVATWDRLRRPVAPAKLDELVPRVGVEAYRANLREMVALSRAHGADPVLLTRPYTGESDDPLWWKSTAPAYRRATLEVAEAADVLAIDVYVLFRERLRLFADESHFTPEGHEVAAEAIARHLRPLLLARAEKSG